MRTAQHIEASAYIGSSLIIPSSVATALLVWPDSSRARATPRRAHGTVLAAMTASKSFWASWCAPDGATTVRPRCARRTASKVPGPQSAAGKWTPRARIPRTRWLRRSAQMHLAVSRLTQPLMERAGRVGLEQIAVQCRFRRLGHFFVRSLARDHDENGGKRQQLGAAQVVKQGLARVGVVTEIVLTQHEFEFREFQATHGVAHAADLHHRFKPELVELGHQDAARGGIAVDHQGAGTRNAACIGGHQALPGSPRRRGPAA